jgi:hypothetical protein
MTAAGPYLRKTQHGYLHWCPGCDHAHAISVNNPGRPNWQFDGNVFRPTVSPSIRIFTPAYEGDPERTDCHYFIRNGQLEFCGDSAHALKGKIVPLPIFPSSEVG